MIPRMPSSKRRMKMKMKKVKKMVVNHRLKEDSGSSETNLPPVEPPKN
jgi:hypothetical protein